MKISKSITHLISFSIVVTRIFIYQMKKMEKIDLKVIYLKTGLLLLMLIEISNISIVHWIMQVFSFRSIFKIRLVYLRPKFCLQKILWNLLGNSFSCFITSLWNLVNSKQLKLDQSLTNALQISKINFYH